MNFLPHYTQTISDMMKHKKGNVTLEMDSGFESRELFSKEIKNWVFYNFQVDGFKMSLSQQVESCWPLWDTIPASV